ncbi:outer membrane protein assembly factor BamE [Congregibacter sp.]|uniref:outer membrane protein assembly factor BamE n=1 Tax=Congregibacter sp. TaxID=2744308 RepID=UPI003F6BF3EF
MIRPRHILRALLLTASLAALSACGFVGFPGVYKIDVEQGNLVTQEMIEQLQPGMSRRQVRFIMGSPLVEDTFQPDRWDYPYVIRNGADIIREAQVRIFFEGDSLVNITGDYLPDWANPNAAGDEAEESQDPADAGNNAEQASAENS